MGQATPDPVAIATDNPGGLGAPYYDPEVPDMAPEEVEALCRKHYGDILLLAPGFEATKQIPRRLGDVTAAELAQDKKAARSLQHLYAQQVKEWERAGIYLGGVDSPSDRESRKFGAQVIIPTWTRSRISVVEARAECIITNLVRFNDRRQVNRMVLRFNNELAGLNRVLALY